MITAKEALAKVPGILRERGWTKLAMADGDGKVCLVGALRVAIFDDPYPDSLASPTYRQAIGLLGDCGREKYGYYVSVTEVNDAMADSVEDVIAVAECARDRAE